MAKKNTICFCQNWGLNLQSGLVNVPRVNGIPCRRIINKDDAKLSYSSNKNSSKLVSNIDYNNEKRIITNDKELNRVLGGGIVPGSLNYLEVILVLENLH